MADERDSSRADRLLRKTPGSFTLHREPAEPGIPEPEPEPDRDPNPAPWHDPGPPVREIDLPPNSPTRGIPVEDDPGSAS